MARASQPTAARRPHELDDLTIACYKLSYRYDTAAEIVTEPRPGSRLSTRFNAYTNDEFLHTSRTFSFVLLSRVPLAL